jgi:heme-degrading monooxygenase HmoA
MFGRASIIEGDPDKIEAGIAFVRDRAKPEVEAMPGNRGLSMWVDRVNGLAMVTTVWEDQNALDASSETGSGLRAEAAAVLGSTNVRVRVAEPAIVWQDAHDQPGYWLRSVEMEVPRGKLDEAVDRFRDERLSMIKELAGVNTVLLLINRADSLMVLNIVFRTKADLDASREFGKARRAEFTSQLGAHELSVIEAETVIVGIRGPEITGQSQPTDRPATTQV